MEGEAPRGRVDRPWVSLAVACALLLSSCNTGTEPNEWSVARVEVEPTSLSLPAGQSRGVTARVIGADGSTLPGRKVFWSSENAAIATVSQSGIVTAVNPGTVRVAASSGGKSGVVNVTVRALPISLVRITPAVITVLVGDTAVLQAVAVDPTGNPVTSVQFEWTSSDPAVVSVTTDGSVVGVGTGTATVSATVDAVSGQAQVTVSQVPVAAIDISPPSLSLYVGETKQLLAVPKDASGNRLPGRQISWVAGAPSVATVSRDGVVTGFAAGETVVFATSEAVTQSAPVTVAVVPVASVRVTPASASVVLGSTQQLLAEPLDSAGNALAARPVAWSSSDQTIAVVSSTGLVQSVAVGTATISATSEGKSGSSRITVGIVPVASVTLMPNPVTIAAGQTFALTATLKDANGNLLSGRPIIWTTSNAPVATVNSSGIVTGVAAGSATITASSEGVSGTASVTVTPAPVASITVVPATAGIIEGATVQLTATAKDVQGNALPRQAILWQSSAPTIAGVSTTGLVTGIAAGEATITASAPGAGVGGTTPSVGAAISVFLASVAQVVGSPQTATVSVGQTTAFTASLFDARGATLTPVGRTIVWRSLAPAIVTVNASTGVATGVASGTGTLEVSAASPGQASPATDTVAVTVINVATVTVSPGPNASMFLGGQYQQTFTAVARDANGHVLPGQPVSWSSSDATVATVNDTSGVAIGVGVGSAAITATVEGVQGSSTVLVTLVPVSAVDVAPTSASIGTGQTVQLTATARDASGTPITGPALGGRAASWLSSQPSVATVSGSGRVTGVGAGVANLTATYPGSPVSNTSVITVNQTVASVSMSVTPADSIFKSAKATATTTALDAGGNPVPIGGGRSIVWASSNVSVATVSQSGDITGVNPGTANVTATVMPDNVAGTLPMRVLAPIATIVVAATVDSLLPAGATSVTATAKDASGISLTGRPFTWSATGSISVNAGTTGTTNTATAGAAPGNGDVKVTAEGKNGTDQLHVLMPVASVGVTLSLTSIQTGQTSQATATPRDAGGHPVAGRQVNWSSSDPATATVTAAGLVTGVAAGTATITATVPLDNVNGASPTLAVAAPVPIGSIAFNPNVIAIHRNENKNSEVLVKSTAGALLSGRQCTITTSDPSIIMVAPHNGTPVTSFSALTDSKGKVQVDVYSNNIQQTTDVSATCEGNLATMQVTVQ